MWLSLSELCDVILLHFPLQAHCAIDCYYGLMNIENFNLTQLCSNRKKYRKEGGMNIFPTW